MAMDHFHARSKRRAPQRAPVLEQPLGADSLANTPARRVAKNDRLDSRLVALGLAPSRTVAQRLIAAGAVRVDGAPCTKAAQRVDQAAHVAVVEALLPRYVSRAGGKLAAALDALGWSVAGGIALDVGQSTGGFTDCLLQRGAKRVVGIEVGHGQLAEALRTEALIVPEGAQPPREAIDRVRIITFEGCHARSLTCEQLGAAYPTGGFDWIVGDLSFISALQVWQAVLPLAAATARLVWLIKPQFELGPEALGKHGVVRDLARHEPALEAKITETLTHLGWQPVLWMKSPMRGGGVGNQPGNHEFLVAAVRG